MKFSLRLHGEDCHDLTIFDWIIFGVLVCGCFVLFSHQDIVTTAEHAQVYLNGGILDFYSQCHEWNGMYAANYMPSTFLAFALWELPLKFLGLLPSEWGGSSLGLVYYYRLLPAAVYACSGILIYKIARELDFPVQKAKIAAFVFLSAPLAVYSQFIFSQYDIFTVFFMLLGLYSYFKEYPSKRDNFFFILYFGIATTFKYYAVLIFAVLLLLRTKKVWKILLSFLGVGIPFAVEALFYLLTDPDAFVKSVFGFQILTFTQNGEIGLGFAALRLFPLMVCILLAWSFFVNPIDRRDRISYALFFCNGICFALFGLMRWHPQWLLFGVAFWTLSTCIHKRFDIFILLDTLFIALFYIFIATVFPHNADQNVLSWGLFHDQLDGRLLEDSTAMADLFGVGSGNVNLIFTALAALLLANFIFKHPIFCQESFSEKITQIWTIRVRLVVGVFLFAVPALLCLPSMMEQPAIVWKNSVEPSELIIANGMQSGKISQYITAQADSIGFVQIRTGTFDRELESLELVLTVSDAETQEELGSSVLKSDEIENNDVSEFVFEEPIPVEKGRRYCLTFRAANAAEEDYVTLYYIPAWEICQARKPRLERLESDYLMLSTTAKRTELLLTVYDRAPEEEEDEIEEITGDKELDEMIWELMTYSEEMSEEEKLALQGKIERAWQKDWKPQQDEASMVTPFA